MRSGKNGSRETGADLSVFGPKMRDAVMELRAPLPRCRCIERQGAYQKAETDLAGELGTDHAQHRENPLWAILSMSCVR